MEERINSNFLQISMHINKIFESLRSMICSYTRDQCAAEYEQFKMYLTRYHQRIEDLDILAQDILQCYDFEQRRKSNRTPDWMYNKQNSAMSSLTGREERPQDVFISGRVEPHIGSPSPNNDPESSSQEKRRGFGEFSFAKKSEKTEEERNRSPFSFSQQSTSIVIKEEIVARDPFQEAAAQVAREDIQRLVGEGGTRSSESSQEQTNPKVSSWLDKIPTNLETNESFGEEMGLPSAKKSEYVGNGLHQADPIVQEADFDTRMREMMPTSSRGMVKNEREKRVQKFDFDQESSSAKASASLTKEMVFGTQYRGMKSERVPIVDENGYLAQIDSERLKPPGQRVEDKSMKKESYATHYPQQEDRFQLGKTTCISKRNEGNFERKN